MLARKLSHLKTLREAIQRYVLTEEAEMAFLAIVLARPET